MTKTRKPISKRTHGFKNNYEVKGCESVVGLDSRIGPSLEKAPNGLAMAVKDCLELDKN